MTKKSLGDRRVASLLESKVITLKNKKENDHREYQTSFSAILRRFGFPYVRRSASVAPCHFGISTFAKSSRVFSPLGGFYNQVPTSFTQHLPTRTTDYSTSLTCEFLQAYRTIVVRFLQNV